MKRRPGLGDWITSSFLKGIIPFVLTSRFNYCRICILISLPPYDKYNTIHGYWKNDDVCSAGTNQREK